MTESSTLLEWSDQFSAIAQGMVATLDLEQVLRRILGTALEMLPADSGLVLLLDEQGRRYAVRASYNLPIADGRGHELSFSAGEGLPDWVRTEGQPLVLADAQSEGRLPPPLRDKGVQSLLSVPLAIDRRGLGALILLNREQRDAFGKNDVRLANVYADFAATAIQNAQLFESVQVHADQADALNQIARAVNTNLDLEAILSLVADEVARLVPHNRASLALPVEQNPGHLRVRPLKGRIGSEEPAGMVTPVTGGGIGTAFAQGRPFIAPNLAEHRYTAFDENLLRSGILSYICVPLRHGDQVIGTLNLGSDQPHAFGSHNLSILDKIAEHVAVAIRNARLYDLIQKRAAQAKALNQIARAVNANLDLETTMDIMADEVARLVPHDRASLALPVEGEPGILQVWLLRGPDDSQMNSGTKMPIEGSGVGWAFGQGEPVVAKDLSEECQFPGDQSLEAEGIRSYVCLPLMQAGQAIGTLNLGSRQPRAYGSDNLAILAQIADQVAIAIRNARLYGLSQRRVAELDMLNDIGRALSGTLDVEDLVEVIYQQTQRVLDADNLYIALYDEDEAEIVFAFLMHQGERQPVSRRKAGKGLTEYILRTRAPLFLRGDLKAKVQALGIEPAGSEPQIWLGVPLIYSDQAVGVLSIQHYQDPHAYDESQLRLLQAIANQAATALHNAQLYREVADERKKLSAILNDTEDVVLVLDRNRKVMLLNPAAEQHLHIRASEVMGRPLLALGIADLSSALEAATESEAPIVREIRIAENRVLYASVSPVHDVGWVMVMQDITPLKELDRLRTEWVAAVSHDLKNPITSIRMSADLMSRAGTLDERQQRILFAMQRSAEQLQHLVTDVLDLARLEAGPALEMECVDPACIIAEALAQVRPLAAKKKQSLSSRLAPKLPAIAGDAAMLRRVIVNLLSNAIKYTAEGGEIAVEARRRNGSVEIETHDTGRGIPPEALPHLFDRFYRVPDTETKVQGSGLGLSIVKSIVEKHGGRIWVESEVGVGSTFRFTVPALSSRG